MRRRRSGRATRNHQPRRAATGASWLAALCLVGTAACSTSSPAANNVTATTAGSDADVTPTGDPASTEQPTVSVAVVDDGSIVAADAVIDVDAPGTPIDPRIRGTNVPAWLGRDTFTSDWFLDAIRDAGVTTIRMPGGSWSNAYDWAGCELGEDSCYWPWAARPSDFVQLLDDTDLEGIWTVSINDTAESAAAAVAFFNGDPTDIRQIGVDRAGVNWGTVGEWAALRVAGGHPEPVGIELWEVGNEVYGGKPASGGDECAAFGWEDVWTCDGVEYTVGDDEHDGYLAFREAMVDVDPTIEVGAVGVSDPSSWSDWGTEVIDTAGGALDFYVVHQYGFDQSPDPDDAFDRAQTMWQPIIDAARDVLNADTLLAITEYNLVSFDAGDGEQSMTRAVNALFVAETLGQFAAGGVDIANQWNIANGTAANGTDYGLVDAADGTRAPQFYGFAIWGNTGDELLDVSVDIGDLAVYPTRRDDGSLAVVVLNLGDQPREFTMAATQPVGSGDATIQTFSADDPSATTLDDSGVLPMETSGDTWQVQVPAWSMSLVEVPSNG